MSKIFWDTNLFIYLVEDYGKLSQSAAELAERMLDRHDQLYTSALTLGEVLVRPLEAGNQKLVESYEALLSRHALVVAFDQDAARTYSVIRRDRTIRAPDAIQLACAAQARVDLFITNDERLSKARIPGIQFIVSLQRAFL